MKTEELTQLPEWTEAQKALDLQKIAQLTATDVNTKLEISDLVARIIPMAARGGSGDEVTVRTAILAAESGHSHAMIDVYRRVGSRWLPEYREAVKDKVLINWGAIVAACSMTPKAPGVDPCKVLVALAQDSTYPVSKKAFEIALGEAVERSVPTKDGPDPEDEYTVKLEDLLDTDPEPINPPASPLDILNDEIDAAGGKGAKKADVEEVKSAAADLLVLEAQATSALEKFRAVRDREMSKPVRDELIVFVKRIIEAADLGPEDLFDQDQQAS